MAAAAASRGAVADATEAAEVCMAFASQRQQDIATFLQEEGGPLPIAELEKHGINASDVKKLMDSGMYTVEAVGSASSHGVTLALPSFVTGCLCHKEEST